MRNRVFPGAAYAFGNCETEFRGYVGALDYESQIPVGSETIYDLASLTKVISTTTIAMRTWPDPSEIIDISVKNFLPEFSHSEITIGHLLRHNSGLPAYDWKLAGTDLNPEEVRSRILSMTLESAPGLKTEYSCLNFVILQAVLEQVNSSALDAQFDHEAKNLGSELGYFRVGNVDSAVLDRCAPTEPIETWRRRILEDQYGIEYLRTYTQGIVHDPVAFYLGGVSGNAGLFGTIDGVANWARQWIVSPEFYSANWQKWIARQGKESTRAFGFDTKSFENSSAGNFFSLRSFGHLGFTGTSIWIDPETRHWGVLLSNRVHPTADTISISQIRPKFYDLVNNLLSLN